ncbi:immunoglobulin superfamily member 3-like [Chiloscyllium punctatum]|uniref:immunoglobulin superfamily member 3-like n=1 Tax=Chiloscyllium punctatum TaxID=137246 RepID=UPI003B633910
MISGTLFAVTLSLCVTLGANAPVLLQSPILEHVTEDHTARLQCTLRNAAVTNTDAYWYREQAGGRREWILRHSMLNYVQQYLGFTERFQSSRDSSSSNFILTITNMQPSDSGIYYCSVWGSVFGGGSLLIVDSASGPVLLQPPVVEHVTTGHTAQLQCTMRNATVAQTIVHWYRQEPGSHVKLFLTHNINGYIKWSQDFNNRFQPSRHHSTNSFILTITNVQPSDTAVYYCSVWGSVLGGGSLVIVNRITGSVLIQTPILQRVTEGHTARLQCTMRNSAVTHTNVQWYRLSPEQIMERVSTHPGSGSTQWSPGFTERFQPFRDPSSVILTITNVQPSDTGVYYCSVWGWIYGRGSQLIVDSITGPVLLQSPSLEHVTQDHTARFQCTMRNATVTHTDVHWYRHSAKKIMEWVLTHPESGSTEWSPGFTERFQHSRDPSSNSFILTITNVQPSDNGVYYCSVWGRIYGRGSQLNITNANVPVLLQSLSLERITEGHTGRLQCTVRNAAVTHTNVHWDREKPGNKVEWVLTHDMRNVTQWSPGFTEQFQSFREPSNNSFILTITNVQPSDTGVYYCKVWGDISGNGTQLTVTGSS